jgi:predicted deacylase
MTSNLSYGPIHCTLDLETAGKRIGYLNLAHSSNRYAFSTIRIPIAVINGGEGPTVLLSAGNHGDEYEGQCLLRRAIRELDAGDINGRLILLPALNSPAVAAATRTSPLDDGNLNRSFPGDPDAGPTQAIAGFIVTHLFPMADFGLDFHSGGSTATYVNTGYLCTSASAALHRRNFDLIEAFAAPYTLVVSPGNTPCDMDSSAHQVGLPFISCELGGAGTVSKLALDVGWKGLLRVLRQNEVIVPDNPLLSGLDLSDSKTYFINGASDHSMVTTSHHGLFEPFHELGAWVEKGNEAGHVYGLQSFIDPLETPRFGCDGVVIVKRRDSLVQPGDHLYCVGEKLTRDQVLELGR